LIRNGKVTFIDKFLPDASCTNPKLHYQLPPVNYSHPKEYTIEIIHHEPLVAVDHSAVASRRSGLRAPMANL
jgi:D-ribose pyranose/furanose isomerase RbsD